MGALQQFTADKRALFAAIDRVQYQLGRVGISSFGPISADDSPINSSAFDAELKQYYLLGASARSDT